MTFLARHPDRGPRNVTFQSARRRHIFADARSICKGWNSKRYVCLNGDTLQRYTATTGFAGISTDAALPLSKAASVLSRVFLFWKQRARRGGNPPTWGAPGIALQKRRFSKKDGKIRRKNRCLDVCSKPDGMNTICSKISL